MWTDFVRKHCCTRRLLNELSSRQLAIIPCKLPVDSPGPRFLYLLNSSPKKPDLAKTGKCICRQIFFSNQFEGKRALTQLNLIQEVWGTGGHTANQKLIFRPSLFLLTKHIKIPERGKNRRFPHQGSAVGLDSWQPDPFQDLAALCTGEHQRVQCLLLTYSVMAFFSEKILRQKSASWCGSNVVGTRM